jgi:biotin operon repressor
MKDRAQFFKALGDVSRLQILKSLRQQDMYVELIAERLKLSPSTVSFHLKKLQEAGLVNSFRDQYYTMYSVNKSVLTRTLEDFIGFDEPEKESHEQREEHYRRKVLDNFIEFGKLKSIPVQRKKRRIILEQLVNSFEFEVNYPEKEVNLRLAEYHDDFCTLRRELIVEGLMKRENSIYWRIS